MGSITFPTRRSAPFKGVLSDGTFKYVLGLPERTIASSLVLGSCLHKAVQYRFEQLMMGREADLDTLLAVFQDEWEVFEERNIRYGDGETRDEIGRMADKLLKEFLRSEFSRPQGNVIGVEEELRGQVIPGCPDLLARVDLIVDAGSHFLVADFKTSRCTWNDFKVEDQAPQLFLYSELVRPLADGKPIKLAFAVLTKTKQPVLTVHDVPLDPHQVERTKRTVERGLAGNSGRPGSIRSHRRSHAEPVRTASRAGNGSAEANSVPSSGVKLGQGQLTKSMDGEEAQCGSKTETESGVRNGQLDYCCRCRLLGTIVVGIHGDRSYLAGPELAHRRYSAKKTFDGSIR